MVRARWWWPLAGTKSGRLKRRSRKRVREVFLGPEIVFSGELKSCDAVVAEGTVESSLECRKFILGSAGCCKGEVQAESAVIRGRFRGSPRCPGATTDKGGRARQGQRAVRSA